MTTFQKLILLLVTLFSISTLFLFSQFSKNQEQIKKDELVLKEQQQKVSECKYLLSNEKTLFEDEERLVSRLKARLDADPNSELYRKTYQSVNRDYVLHLVEYIESEDNCRDLLRQLGQE